jgi:hypothetical protein
MGFSFTPNYKKRVDEYFVNYPRLLSFFKMKRKIQENLKMKLKRIFISIKLSPVFHFQPARKFSKSERRHEVRESIPSIFLLCMESILLLFY